MALVAALPLFVSACAGVSRPFGRIFQSSEPEVETGKPAEQATPMVYYTGSEGLALYREPGRDVVIRLPLHQKVLRYRLERGYAYVRVEGTGQEGWIENSKLIWRLPRQPAAVQPPGSPPAAGVETTTEPEVSEPAPPAQPSDEATSTAPDEQPPEEIPPDGLLADELPPPDEVPADEEPAQAPAGTPGSVSPSVFEPF